NEKTRAATGLHGSPTVRLRALLARSFGVGLRSARRIRVVRHGRVRRRRAALVVLWLRPRLRLRLVAAGLGSGLPFGAVDEAVTVGVRAREHDARVGGRLGLRNLAVLVGVELLEARARHRLVVVLAVLVVVAGHCEA